MKKTWWKEAVAYEVYPRSFMDSSGDGIGDLRGIIYKLDYLKDLGIDLIWICPMYKSPNDDNGYDICDYQDIMEDFGTMEDFDELLSEVHNRGMKLIIDLVVNHTSDEHPWFIESKSSKDNPKRHWYIWRDGKNGMEPNNWESIFRESAWKYDDNTKQYFLHLFSRRQPDLNWENIEVRQAIYKMINWWLDKGIDGFRVDAISHIKKEKNLIDIKNPKGLKYVPSFEKHMNVDGIHDFLEELKENTFSKYDIVTVGEANGVKAEDAGIWVGEEEGKFNLLFQFEHRDLWEISPKSKISLVQLKKILSRWQKGVEGKGWNALYFENHDVPRVVSNLGDAKEYWYESATSLAVMYFLMQGTPFIYQGQEIGMTNIRLENLEDYKDVLNKNMYQAALDSGASHDEAMEEVYRLSRDNSRTPMQWNNKENAGFTTGTPWICVNPNYVEINVEKEEKDPKSVLNFYKKMILIKKQNEVLTYGSYDLILEDHNEIYAYTRKLDNEMMIIICNISSSEANYENNNINLSYKNLLLNNYEVSSHEELTSLILRPYETRVYRANF